MINTQQNFAKRISSIFPANIQVHADFDPIVEGMSLDSRRIKKHDLFVAKIGEQYDGRNFIDAAVANGACVILSEQNDQGHESFSLHESGCPIYSAKNIDTILGSIAAKFYGSAESKLQVIGVTGTNGKTSVCQFLAQALTQLGHRVAILGTTGNGFLPDLEYSALTTQDVLSLHKMLSEFSEQGADFVCMEVSSHSLDQQRVSGIKFSHVIFTNLSQDHLDYHLTMENYAAAKTKLFHFPEVKFAAIKLDETGLAIEENLPETVSSFGLAAGLTDHADLKITSLEHQNSALSFQFQFKNTKYEIQNENLMGEFNAENLSLCFLSLVQLGIDEQRACKVLASVKPAQGRMQKVPVSAGLPNIYVDFAHTPDALEKTLQTLASFTKANIILVFGCGGDRDRAKRSLMAQVAEKFAQSIFVTSDNPRTEAQSQIASDILSGFDVLNLSKVHREDDRKLAIEKAIQIAGENDVVLIAGKGHESFQIFADKTLPFNDEAVALEVLKRRQAKEGLQ